MRQAGLFDIEERLRDLSAKGDDLERVNGLVDFEAFRPELERAVPRSDRAKGGDETGALAKVEAAKVKAPGPGGAPSREPVPAAAPKEDDAGPTTQRSAPGALVRVASVVRVISARLRSAWAAK